MTLTIPDITKTGSNEKRIDCLIDIVLKKITTTMGGGGIKMLVTKELSARS